MIKLIACDCGSSEQLIRQALHKYEYKNWAMEPIKKGKVASLSEIEELIRQYPDSTELKALFAFVNNSSKWCVVLGYDSEMVRWSDISKHDMKSDIEAEAIISRFA